MRGSNPQGLEEGFQFVLNLFDLGAGQEVEHAFLGRAAEAAGVVGERGVPRADVESSMEILPPGVLVFGRQEEVSERLPYFVPGDVGEG